jgi:hypothetical protein
MNKNITFFSIKNSRWIREWMRHFCNSGMREAANMRKTKGASVGLLLLVLLALPFCDLRVWHFAGSTLQQAPGRDSFYRFLSNTSYNWRRLLLAASAALISQFDRLTGPRKDRVVIIDDSPYKRTRSKAVEYLGYQYDHSDDKHYRGFRMLTCGWSDGHSFVPIELELLTNNNQAQRIGPDPRLDGRTTAGKRCRQARRKATDLAVEMVERVTETSVTPDYVVFDSWFSHPRVIKKCSRHVPVVCRLKNLPNIAYLHANRIYTLKSLYQKVCRRKRSKPDGPVIGSITAQMLGGVKVRVVFIRDQDDPEKWIALGSTDLDITPQRMCRIYAKRWAIEVFFRQIKQQLGLPGEVQVRSYTACVAFASVVFLRYMMLSYYRRQCEDERTIPGLFYAGCQELQSTTIEQCMKVIVLEMMITLSKKISPEIIEAACAICGIIDQFIHDLNYNSIVFKPLGFKCES